VPTNDQWPHPACPLVSSSKTKPCQFGSVQLFHTLRVFTSFSALLYVVVGINAL